MDCTPRATKESQSSTPRTATKTKKLRQPEPASTMANAGSNSLNSSAPAFGSALSRFSPSMTFAHQVAPSASLPRHRQPNRKWQPPALAEDGPGNPNL